MEKLPDEIVEIILNASNLCKKNQNLYVNKHFFKLAKKKTDNCKKMYMLKQNICVGCHPHVIKFINTYYGSFY